MPAKLVVLCVLVACSEQPSRGLPVAQMCSRPQLAGPEAHLLASHLGAPWAIAPDGDGAVFSSFAAGMVARVDPAGTIDVLVSSIRGPSGVAVDGTKVYYATSSIAAADGTIEELDRASGDTHVLARGRAAPRRLAIADGFLYWVDGGTFSGDIEHPKFRHDAALARISLDGGPVETLFEGRDQISDFAIDGDSAYVTAGKDVLAVRGGKARRLIEEGAGPFGVALADGYVAYVLPAACAVRRIPIGGGDPETIADDENWPVFIASDDRGLVWTNESNWGSDFLGSAVVRAGSDGTDRHVIAAAHGAWGIATTGTTVYFTNDTLDGDVASITEAQ